MQLCSRLQLVQTLENVDNTLEILNKEKENLQEFVVPYNKAVYEVGLENEKPKQEIIELRSIVQSRILADPNVHVPAK